MYRSRVIPCLLLSGQGLVKTQKFKNPVYIGDAINAVRIFSEKEVDELCLLDIDASKDGQEPNYQLIEELAGECFMPLAYGGGVRNMDQVYRLIRSGVEKIVINSTLCEDTTIIREISDTFGSQAVMAAIDVRKSMFGKYKIYSHSGSTEVKAGLESHIEALNTAGVGEIFINSIDKDGTMTGFDLDLIKKVSERTNVPVIACGGAGNEQHLKDAINIGGASAVAAGSMFIFHGKHRAVLINYPSDIQI